jgi:ubiquinol-cytochrome c reductase cytochrome b subunit
VGPAVPWTDDQASLGSETFAPRQVYMDAIVIAGVFLVVATLAFSIPLPLTDKANPSDTSFVPVPEWYFILNYELLKYVHGPLEPLATWVLPLCVILIMLFWPFIDRNSVRNPIRRPVALCSGLLFLLVVVGLLGISINNLYAVPRTDPAVARGKTVYDQLGCVGCHRIHGEGGAVAPDLSIIGDTRPDRARHLKHFRDPQSVSPGSFMPKFPLTDEQLNDLPSYMLSMKRAS